MDVGDAGTWVGEFQMEVCILKYSREGLKIDKGIIGNHRGVLNNEVCLQKLEVQI